jgi:hypothetical protein
MALSILTTLLFMLLSSAAQANSCIDIFKVQNEAIAGIESDHVELSGIKIVRDTSPQEIKSKKDPKYRESLKNILMMLTETQFQNISKKGTDEKGELRLGKVFDDGLSLEFVYEGDLRTDVVFNLKKIKLIKPNGQDEKVDDKPTPDFGLPPQSRTIVVKKDSSAEAGTVEPLDKKVIEQLFESKELQSVEVQKKVETLIAELKEVKVPYKIEGVLVEGLKSWTQLVQHVKRPVMRQRLENDQLIRLYWQARTTKRVRWMGEQLDRLMFREAIRTAVLVGLAYNFVAPSLIDRLPAPAPLASTAQSQTINRSAQVIDLIADLSQKETTQNGSPLFYTGSAKDSGFLMTAQAKDSNLIISLFPKQEKIVVIPDPKTAKDRTPIILTRAENQKAYDFIADRMEDLYAGRRR